MPKFSFPIGNARPESGTIGGNNLDFCRFWLSMVVIFSHSFVLAQGNDFHEPVFILTSGQLNAGHLAVCCFFAISGFLITHSWLRSRSAFDFLWKRVLRIYPGYIVAVLIGLLVVAPIGSDKFELSTRKLLLLPLNLLAFRGCHEPGVFSGNPFPGSVNGSLWSIPYEFKCYWGLPIIGAAGLLGRNKRMMIVLFGFTLTGSAAYSLVASPLLDHGPFAAIIGRASAWCGVLPYFLAGMVYYLFRHRIPFSSTLASAAMISAGMAALLSPACRIVFPLAITYLLFWFAFHPLVRCHRWARYGDFSYGSYLYAFPIQQLIVKQIPGIAPLKLFAIAAPLSVIAGVISWNLAEKHFLSLKHRMAPPNLTQAGNELRMAYGWHDERNERSSFQQSQKISNGS